MVIVLNKNITSEEKEHLKEFLTQKNFKINEIVGEEATILAAVGKLAMDPREVEIQPGVSRVIPISKPYKMASREFKRDDTVVEIPNSRGQIIRVGGKRVAAIAGPCAVESQKQMLEIAAAVASSGAVMLRGGAYKPRTSPYSFQGLGEQGLVYLKTAGEKYGLPVVTEIVSTDFIPVMKDYVDVYQVGARNMQNFELLKKLGALNKPVILKRGLSATIEELLMAAEYLLSSGTDKVILCERGIRTFEKATRNTLDLSAVPVLRSLTHLPIIVDPSHAVGIRDKIPPMGLAAIAAGADGIIVEVHNHPEKALSDGAQSLYPAQFDKMMHDIEALAPVVGKSVEHIREEAPKNLTEISSGKSLKNGKTVCAYSGKKGAYAEQAIARYFDEKDVSPLALESFSEIFQAVVDGKADYGMVPIENSLAGSVFENYDNFKRFEDVSIVGSVTLRIQHSLLGVKGAALSDVKKVFSHPQGFSQCRKFLEQNKSWEHIDSASTATAAQMVGESKSKENAAIASSVNSSLYNLDVIQENIEDDPSNFTRFVIIAANHVEHGKEINIAPNMATFMFTTKNEPGALYNCLGVFEKNKLNLTRIESRPIAGQPWKYWFYADAALTKEDGSSMFQTEKEVCTYVNKVIEELKDKAEDVRLLGVYSESRY
ncbi:MAG: 3-deoxy-7-phosphoheptulonate synthase [Treponema sp.]